MKWVEYWVASGGSLRRPRRMKRSSLTEFALKQGFDGDAVHWIITTAAVVCYLRNEGYAVEYHREQVEDGNDD